MAQELDGGIGEHALLCVDDQACITQARKYFPQMLQMLLLVSAGDDNVVKVAEDKGESRQDPVHHALEGVAPLRSLKGMRRNSNSPNGVQMAVFLMSAGCIGI